MSGLLLFTYISFSIIFVVRSHPLEQNISDNTILTSLNHPRDNETDLYCPCLRNITSSTEINNNPIYLPIIHGTIWKCNFVGNKLMRDDYYYSPGIGSHKLHTRAKTWNEARKICIEEGGHLAIINSIAEADILLNLFNRSGPIKGATYNNLILLGIHDLYTEDDWVTIQGDSLAKSGYNAWTDRWGGQPDNRNGVQNCGALLEDADDGAFVSARSPFHWK
ncbi:hemolymph lipopolysaccharide-binding protein-like isoform X2 [Vespa velutina]|uniref:hemolymph lipopolysaccharide-binding protein-like isoform X2 n=1 Tax=Vespa velutina TaxID=202808 RepID=UPI001FB56409|nr:hemolymph lipopolysaccharide-binding protein-like isoform X2 [Vespa velutina]